MTQDTTTTSGAADLRTAAQAVVDRWDTPLWKDVPATAEYIGRLRAALAAGQATAAPAQPAAQQPHHSGCTAGTDEECVQRGCGTNCPAVSPRQGVAYAALPTSSYAGRVYEEGFLIGTCPLYTDDQMRAFADATHALRASHGQAPAGATEPTEQQILEAAFSPAQPAAEPSRFGSPELQAMIIARCVEKDQADSGFDYTTAADFLSGKTVSDEALRKFVAASRGAHDAQPAPAYSEACNLATALFKKHFAHLPDFASGQAVWSLCDSTAGVILQIDNMVSGLVQPPTTAPHADSVLGDAARYRFLRDGEWRDTDLEPFIRLQLNTLWDAKIDAARKQGEKQ